MQKKKTARSFPVDFLKGNKEFEKLQHPNIGYRRLARRPRNTFITRKYIGMRSVCKGFSCYFVKQISCVSFSHKGNFAKQKGFSCEEVDEIT